MRQRHELDLRVERVVGRARAGVEAPEQPQPAQLTPESAEEAHECALAVNDAAAFAIEVVGVGDESHDGHLGAERALVSVLIPVLNEAAHLDRAVSAMLSQRFEGEIEFIFAEGGSGDDSRAILKRFAALDPRVRIVENPSGRTPDGLNRALEAASGDFIARMDAHAVYPDTYLANGVARLRCGDVAWVAGPKLPRGDGGTSAAVALALSSPLGQGPSRRIARRADDQVECDLDTGVFTGMWRRTSLERHGGWDPRWLRNQDSELAARFLAAGERIVSLSSMTAEYLPRRTLSAFYRQYHQYGRYRAFTVVRHPIARRRSHALAPALIAAIPAAMSGARYLRAPARAALGAYAAAVAIETARAARTAPLGDTVRLPAAFAVMHLGFGAGMWRGLAECWLRQPHRINSYQRSPVRSKNGIVTR
jgi:succinoglycan biosynthesis protein ExoA